MTQLDDKTTQIMHRLWMPAIVTPDPPQTPVRISAEGLIIGYSEEMQAESDLERWSTFDLNHFRKTNVAPDSLLPLIEISADGMLAGQTGFGVECETDAESSFLEASPESLPDPWTLTGG